DLFRQPALARTLRSVAEQGSAYVYEGAWAERFVAAVRRDGGFVTLDDLKAYEARWAPPTRVPYRGFEVALPALPAHGGLAVAEGLRVAERLDVAGFGSITASAESFFWLHQASVLFALNHVDEKTASAMIGGLDASPEARLTAE